LSVKLMPAWDARSRRGVSRVSIEGLCGAPIGEITTTAPGQELRRLEPSRLELSRLELPRLG